MLISYPNIYYSIMLYLSIYLTYFKKIYNKHLQYFYMGVPLGLYYII